ncbi:MAG: hypothetical protein OQJ93_00380 [Ignavibacteriaceae bacterium]|nr:hypothetical protein [Ignavibacteriaceae bacterium]MCW9095818.1 hypothetical protein [Ignavibacteriaceae bacterium]
MTKNCTLLIIMILLSISTFSQSRFNAGASFNIGFPASSFSNIAKTGIGGSAIGEFAFSKQVSATLTASYQNFPGKSEGVAYQGKVFDFSVNSIPVMAGIRYYFSNEFFGTLEAGVDFLRVSADIYDVYNNEKISTDYQSKFGGGIGIGYRYILAEPSVFELLGNYQFVEDDFNSFAIKMGVLILLDNI